MKKKLTLTIEESVTRRAKRVAKKEGTSISDMVEKFLSKKVGEESEWAPEPGSWTAELLGSVTLPEDHQDQDIDIKKIKEKEILRKYGS